MKSILWTSALGLTLAVGAAELELPMYEQKLSVTFKTEAEAKAAAAAIETMPIGKKVAFSTRWDDSNPKHLEMIKTLAAQGYKASFYLNKLDGMDVVARETLKAGGNIGAHTMTHPHLPKLNENAIYGEIIGNRIQLECMADAPVTTFTLPFCDYKSPDDPAMPQKIGKALTQAGLLGSPEFWPDVASFYKLGKNEWVGSYTFAIDDRNPQQKLFDEAIAKFTKQNGTKGFACGPHLTLGIHTWQNTAENFKKLEDIIATYAHRPEVWYCNENEYVGFRIQALNSKVERKAVKGKTVEFTVTRPEAFALGAAEPLCVKIPGAVSVALDDVSVKGTDEVFALDAPKGRIVPTRIDAVYAPAMISKKFPELACVLKIDGKTVTLTIENKGKQPLKDYLIMTPRFSPSLKVPAQPVKPAVVKSGFAQTWSCELPKEFKGPLWLVVQCDFTDEKGPARLYVVQKIDPPAEQK